MAKINIDICDSDGIWDFLLEFGWYYKYFTLNFYNIAYDGDGVSDRDMKIHGKEILQQIIGFATNNWPDLKGEINEKRN